MRIPVLSLTLLLACSLADTALAGGREPGSLLVFPVHHSGGGLFTCISVTNTNTAPSTVGGLGGSTNAHFYYTNIVPNPADPFRPIGCSIFDRIEPLTPADTVSVLTECHDLGIGFAKQGYLVVVAEDPTQFEVPWSHNHLLGSELVLSATGFTYTIAALAFRSPAPDGAPTDVDGDQERDFNGIEYEALPDRLYIDSFLPEADPFLVLLNLTGDAMDHNTVLFSVWNDYEVPLSASLVFRCWFEVSLTRISPLFTSQFLAGVLNDPDELDFYYCDGVQDFEMGWVSIQSLGVRTPGGAFVAADGAMLGAITSGVTSAGDPHRQLGESKAKQANGAVRH
jgi:hypothetical protein